MRDSQRVVFVCEHGAAKSILAATEFDALANARGVAARAVARGTAPASAIEPIVVDRLANEGVDLGSVVPTALSNADLEGALRVVILNQPQLASSIPRDISIDVWNDIPAVGDDIDRALRVIRDRVMALLDELESADAVNPPA
jgi:arsenate reductase